MKKIFSAVAVAFLSVAPLSAQAPTVAPPTGAIQGEAQGMLRIFRGIPYARAPVGDLRWRPPVDLPAWDGTRAATSFGPACVQPRPRSANLYTNPPKQMSEDCLTLNIWTPTAARGLPVFVWIHGGALTSGYSHEPIYDGARMASKGLVVVSINYRLGILGYLAHPGLTAESSDGVSGNYGLLDQIAALEWVKRNIAAFGGDPDKVTVAGESAGALSVMYLMASPRARGLFGKAIAQSAYMTTTPALKQPAHGLPSAETSGTQIMAALGASSLADLRAMDAEKLTDAAAAKGFGPWAVVDGKILTRQLVDTWDRGEQAPVPILAGFNSGEIRSLRILAPPPPTTKEAYEAAIRSRYGDLADHYLALYPSTSVVDSILANTRDALYGWTSVRLAVGQTSIGQRGYLYLFDHGYPAADDNGLHAFHASELPYVFGTMGQTPPYWPKIPDTLAEKRTSDAMLDYWTSFAKTGVPVAARQAPWQPYGKEANYMAFAQKPTPDRKLFPGMFALHEATVCRRRVAGDQPWNWNTGIVSPVLVKAATCR
jgi:para-nitrobenzyl esterase